MTEGGFLHEKAGQTGGSCGFHRGLRARGRGVFAIAAARGVVVYRVFGRPGGSRGVGAGNGRRGGIPLLVAHEGIERIK